MRQKLAEYVKDNYYENEDGLGYEDARGLLQEGILGFCGGGAVGQNLRYILDGLTEIESYENAEGFTHSACFKSDAESMFFKYWSDKEELTEHGVGVGACWLTLKGKDLLSLLRELEKLDRDAPPPPI